MIASTKNNRFRATLFLRESTKIDGKTLIKKIERTFPKFRGELLDLGPYENLSTFGIQMRDVTVKVSLQNAPQPLGNFSAAAASVGAWPRAAQENAAHKAVAVITHHLDAEGISEVQKLAKVVSLISLTVADILPTIGLHWLTSDAMVSKRTLETLEDKDLPMSLWFRLFWFHEETGPAGGGMPLTSVTVRGLEPFIGWELEVLPCAHDALALEEGVSYLCRSVLKPGGSVLQHAETSVRLTEAIRMPVRHRLSRNFPKLPVIQLGELPDAPERAAGPHSESWRRFGPDAGFSGIAKWLNDNIETIDAVFSIPGVTSIRLGETLCRQHPHVEHESTTPVMQAVFERGLRHAYQTTDLRGFGARGRETLIRFEQALGENAALLKRHCVLREEVFFIEVLDLAIWPGGVVVGTVRYPGMGQFHTAPEYEVAAQYFTWVRQENRYVGRSLEIRLWGVYIPDFILEDRDGLNAIARDPKSLLESPEILPGRETGYVALYQMQRPPSRVEWGTQHVSAFYDGENPEVLPFLSEPA